MTVEQPEAPRIATWLEETAPGVVVPPMETKAAELRLLREECENWKKGYATLFKENADRRRAHDLLLAKTAAPHPLPDAIHHTDTSEHPEYIAGWNDCLQAMRSMK